MPEEQVVLTQQELDAMYDRLRWLNCLEQAGVDNWDGYDYARGLYRNEEEE